MRTTLTYIFDPLCGWCYGAGPAIQQLASHADVDLELAPSGLFASTGRTMDAAFADFAWANDQRIQALTGQPFSASYRSQVLGQLGRSFDSTATTLALTAVRLTTPDQELPLLKALQSARYVSGVNTSIALVVQQLLEEWGHHAAAALMQAQDAELLQTNAHRMEQARHLMRQFGAQGVPALVVHGAHGSRLLPSQSLFGKHENLLQEMAKD